MDNPIEVTRAAELDLLPHELWELIADGERWSDWMVDVAEIEVEPGATGEVTVEDEQREVHIDHVEEGERVGFTWWPVGWPNYASTVELHIVQSRRATVLEIVETLPPTIRSAAGASHAWAFRCDALGARWRMPIAA